MTNYSVSWTQEIWYKVNIKANSAEEAKEKFWSGEFDTSDTKETGAEIQDGIDIEELEEES